MLPPMDHELPVESPPCPVCGHEDYDVLLRDVCDRIWHKPGVFNVARCRQCQLVATRPRPTAESLSFYYEDTYSGESEDGMNHFQTESWVGRLISRYRLWVIEKVRKIDRDDRILDVGCSYGGFLRMVRTTRGASTSGIDADAGSIAAAVDPEETDYRVGFLTDADYPRESFSLVTFFESLEHHTEPVEALRTAHDLLEPGGYCVVEVPNFAGAWRHIFRSSWLPLLIPQHVFHFTPKTLRQTFKAAGFSDVVHLQTMFYPLEGVASLGIWLARLLRTPPPGSPPTWRTPFDLLVLLLLIILYVLVEIPSQALLNLFGMSGHQLAIAQRPQTSPSLNVDGTVPTSAAPAPETDSD